MDELIIRYFNGEITASEKRRLFSRMEGDEALRKQFAEAQNLRALTAWLPQKEDQEGGEERWGAFREKRMGRRFRLPYRHLVGYVATVCAAVLAAWFVMRPSEGMLVVKDDSAVRYEEFVTPPGQRAQVRLSDGTVVWLNARSRLRCPDHFSADRRRVELDGEAFFEVSKDEGRPFVVSTDKLDIKALGTKFNVHSYNGRSEFRTILVEGSVRVYSASDERSGLLLKPNECADLVAGKLRKSPVENMDFLLWTSGIYAFDDVPFSEIIDKLELYYDVRIDVQNPRLGTYRFSGKFRQRDGVESVLHTLRKVRYFTYTKDDDRNLITIR